MRVCAKRQLVVIAAVAAVTGSVSAATVSKANNTNALNLTTSWVGGVVPGSDDIAQWDNTVTAANTTLLGADLGWQGIAIANPSGAVTISAGNTLTLGTSGIDMSAATQSLTLNSAVTLGNDQIWSVASGRTLTAGGAVGGTGALTKSGAGALTLSVANGYSGATSILAGTVTFSNVSAFGSATSAITLGDSSGSSAVTLNHAAANGTLNRNLVIASGNTGVVTLKGNSNSTAYTYSGSITLGSDNSAGHGVTLSSSDWSTLNYSGAIKDAAGMTPGTAGVVTISTPGNGVAYLSGNSTFTGGVVLKSGNLAMTGKGLGTGTLTIDGGNLKFSQSGDISGTGGNNAQIWNTDFTFANTWSGFTLNLGSGAVNLGASAGSSAARTVTVSTSQTVDYLTVGGIISDGTNGITKGLTKSGNGTLNLNGANTYTGGTTINAGILGFGANAVPATGMITINNGGALKATGAYSNVTNWLGSGKIATASTGAIGLTGNSSENIDFSSYSNLMLGAAAAATYTGTITPANDAYRLGGGGSTLTLSNVNALTGARTLTVGTVATATGPAAAGTVSLNKANDMTGATTVNSGTLNLTTFTGALANSDVTVNSGATLSIDSASGTAAPSVTRAKSVTLKNSSLTVTSASAANTNDVIAGAITATSGLGTITLTPNATTPKNSVLTADSIGRSNGGALLVRGANFGVNTIASATANSSNVVLNTTPTFTGSTDTSGTTMQMLPWAIGDNSGSGNGTDFLTYDSAYGLRRLAASEYVTTFASGNATQDNAKVTTAITGITAATTLNSLTLGTGGSVNGAGTLSVASGGVLSTGATTGIGNTTAGTLAFGSNEGIVTAISGSALTIGSAITGSGGITKNGAGTVILTAANSYTGGTVLNGGTLDIRNASSLGTGTLTINGGSFYQNLNADLTIGANVPEVWNGSFSVPNNGNIKTLNTGSTNNVTLGNSITLTVSGYCGFTVPGVISDGGNGYSLTVAGAGSRPLTLSANNTFSGGVTLASGQLSIGNSGALGTGVFTILGGSVGGNNNVINNNEVWAGNFSVTGATGNLNTGTGTISLVGGMRTVSLTNNSLTVPGVISNGSGSSSGLMLSFGQFSSSATLNGANTFDGGVKLSTSSNATGGTLNIGNLGTAAGSSLGTGPLTVGPVLGGTLNIDNTSGAAGTLGTNNAQAWNGDFTFVGTRSLNMGTGAVTLGGNRTVTIGANTFTVGGIGDGGNAYGLTKAGAGTMVLAGANTYGGNTTITAGSLTLDSAGSILLDINDAGSNKITGTGTVNLNGTLTLDVAGVTQNGQWSIVDVGTLSESYGGTFALMIGSTAFTPSGTVYSATLDGRSWTFDQTTGVLAVAIPEPSTIMAAMGVIGLAMMRRQRARS